MASLTFAPKRVTFGQQSPERATLLFINKDTAEHMYHSLQRLGCSSYFLLNKQDMTVFNGFTLRRPFSSF